MNCPVCEYRNYNGGKCPSCGSDTTNLIRLRELPHIYYNKAVGLIRENRLEEAKVALMTVIELESNDVDALILLGEVYAETDDYERAIFYWNKASGLDESKAEKIKADIERVEALKKALAGEEPLKEKEDFGEKLRATIREETRKGLARWTAYTGAILVLVVILGFYFSFRVFIPPLKEQQVIEKEKEIFTSEIKKILALHNFSNIFVEERGGIVYLNGKVLTLWDKQKIEEAIKEVKGLSSVDMRGVEVLYPRGYYYKVKEGESLWVIAERLLGDGKRFEEIRMANKEILKDLLKLPVGEKLLVPE